MMPYTGTAWASAEMNRDGFIPIHMIMARYDTVNKKTSDYVMVGDNAVYSALASVTWSKDGYVTLGYSAVPTGEPTSFVHVAFDSRFEETNVIYAGYRNSAAGAAAGSVYRFTIGKSPQWDDMMLAPSAVTTFHRNAGIYGLAVAFTGPKGLMGPSGQMINGEGALYAAHAAAFTPVAGAPPVVVATPAGVDRTLEPLTGLPKPGIAWDCLSWFANTPGAGSLLFPASFGINGYVQFTEEPWSLKICGCLTVDTDTNLFAIDNSNMYYTTGTGGRGPGMGDLWMYTDCMAKKAPKLIMADKALIGCDPVSGRNQEINFTWEQLCIAVGYDIEISKDTAWTLRVFDWMALANPGGWPPAPSTAMGYIGFNPSSLTSPAFIFPVAGAATAFAAAPPALVSALECGHTYYWRVEVRQCATGQVIRSPWSEQRSFTIKAGLPVSMPYYGLQLLAPDNGCLGCPVKPVSFSWSPYKETTKYKFVLAKDAAMTQIVVEATPTTTGYEYESALDYSANYFWRVMSMEPAPSDWSATFSFMTQPAPPAPAAPLGPPATPVWVWVVIAIGAILVIVTLVLIFKTRRV